MFVHWWINELSVLPNKFLKELFLKCVAPENCNNILPIILLKFERWIPLEYKRRSPVHKLPNLTILHIWEKNSLFLVSFPVAACDWLAWRASSAICNMYVMGNKLIQGFQVWGKLLSLTFTAHLQVALCFRVEQIEPCKGWSNPPQNISLCAN